MTIKNILYAQSGGVTAVINATACGVIQTARQHPSEFGKVFAAKNGIIGALNDELIDTSLYSDETIAKLKHTPGGAFGSCRHKLKSEEELQRLLEIFNNYDIGYFFYNGGGDSQDTAFKVASMARNRNLDIKCIGIPKTIDNDLPFTDTCPGFGSVAKYVAVSTLEASLDVKSMAKSSTKVFILEVMGRHAGWIASASALASNDENGPPHIILFPEIIFDKDKFLQAVEKTVRQEGYCVVVASEGIKNSNGEFISQSGSKDSFGHAQLGGVAVKLAQLIEENLKLKHHWAVSDYLQRSARHIASNVDLTQSYELGRAAVLMAKDGITEVMPIIKRISNNPYEWTIEAVELAKVANVEHKMPKDFISKDGFGITQACREYLTPLIQGEAYPPYINGIPDYVQLD